MGIDVDGDVGLSGASPRILGSDVTRVAVGELRLSERNPRRGDVAAIRESLLSNGQYRPLVVNLPTREVLVGNHTLRAIRELGWAEVAVVFVDVDEDHARRILLVDNRSSDLAGYDEQELADLLSSCLRWRARALTRSPWVSFWMGWRLMWRWRMTRCHRSRVSR